MALFERLGAFKSWAKETGAAKAALAKDKRLEEPLSTDLTTDHFILKNVATYGTPGPVTTIAYDPVQSILAIGTKKGCVKIFGKGISCTLCIEKPAPIKFLMFQSGHPKLAVVDSRNILTVFDLDTQRIFSTLAIRGYVTSIEMVPGADWLFLGLADGTIDVFDLRVGKMSPYRIPDLMTEWRNFQVEERMKQGLEGPTKIRHPKVELVSSIQFHSTDLNQLLIAYETAVILWNLRDNVAVRGFEFGTSDANKSRVTAMSWKPNGESQFVVGYDDGLLCLWDAEHEEQPISWRYIFQEHHKNQDRTVLNEPIYRLAWCSNADFSETYLVVAGGTHPSDNHGINVLIFNKDSSFRDPARQTILPVQAEVADFTILPWTSPYFLGTHDPLGVAVLTTKGDTLAFSLQQGYAEYLLPSAFSFGSPWLRQFRQYTNVDGQLYEALIAPPPTSARLSYLPLTGGIAGPRHVYRLDTTDFMITAHEGGIIRMWDSSFVALRPLPHHTLHTQEFVAQPQRSEITAFDFSEKTGLLAVACASGVVLCFVLNGPEEDTDPGGNSNDNIIHDLRMTQKNIENLDSYVASMIAEETVPYEASNEHSSLNPGADTISTNPFLNDTQSPPPPAPDDPVAETLASEPQLSTSPTAENPTSEHRSIDSEERHLVDQLENSNILSSSRIEIHERQQPQPGAYVLDFTLQTSLNDIVAVTQSNNGLLAVAGKSGHICIIDTHARKIVFDSIIGTGPIDNENTEDVEPDVPVVDVDITTIKFVHSYPPHTDKKSVLQLLVGKSDGSLHQISFTNDATSWVVLGSDQVFGSLGSRLLDVYVIDLQGQEQSSGFNANIPWGKETSPISELVPSPFPPPSAEPAVDPEPETAAESGVGFLKRSLTRRQSKSNKSTAPRRSKTTRDTSESPKVSRSRVQKNPHLCIIVTEMGIRVHLNVSQLKLFSFSTAELTEDENYIGIVNANLIRREVVGAIALSCLLSNGNLAIFSLPHLELIGTHATAFEKEI
ncbi:WD40-repeat-containing domain protein [Umbelopsis sp. PMI_123]|nr:WD40-repeat-containing domain protein [Umbelopsis sp. PMI_123]